MLGQRRVALALGLLAAAGSGAAAAAQDAGWRVDTSGGGVFGSTQTGAGEADISGAYVGASVARRLTSSWFLGVGVDSYRSKTESDDPPASLEGAGTSGSATLTWAGESAYVALSGTAGSETQDLELTIGPITQARENEGALYGAALTAGVDHVAGGWVLTPSVTAAYDYADYEKVVIDAGVLGEIVRDPDFTTVSADAGLNLARLDGAVRPSIGASVVYAHGESEVGVYAQRAGRGRLVASGEDAVWGELGGGLDLDLTGSTVLGLSAGTSIGREGGEGAHVGLSLSGSW